VFVTEHPLQTLRIHQRAVCKQMPRALRWFHCG
jgi:hypothetical protein